MDIVICILSGESNMVINTDTNKPFPRWSFKNGARGRKKTKKHAIKIPSSLGLFIVDSSGFFVRGPTVQKKGGGETKDKIQKGCICRKTRKDHKRKKIVKV